MTTTDPWVQNQISRAHQQIAGSTGDETDRLHPTMSFQWCCGPANGGELPPEECRLLIIDGTGGSRDVDLIQKSDDGDEEYYILDNYGDEWIGRLELILYWTRADALIPEK